MPRPRSGTDAAPPGSFVETFPARIDLLPATRRAFIEWLERNCTNAEGRGDLTVVYSELTTNAVHASPTDSVDVAVRAWCEGADIVLEVANVAADDEPDEHGWDLDDPLRSGGRGLVIVRAFVDTLDVRRERGRHIVSCQWSDCDD